MKSIGLVALLDESGSMDTIKGSTIEAVNTLLEQQRLAEQEDGVIRLVSLYVFSVPCKPVFINKRLSEISPLNTETYKPSGNTALYDAIVFTVNEVCAQHSENKDEKPEKVMYFIMTDGEENSSRDQTQETAKNVLEHVRLEHGWDTTFMGANIDAKAAGSGLGLAASASLSWDSTDSGVMEAMQVVAAKTTQSARE